MAAVAYLAGGAGTRSVGGGADEEPPPRRRRRLPAADAPPTPSPVAAPLWAAGRSATAGLDAWAAEATAALSPLPPALPPTVARLPLAVELLSAALGHHLCHRHPRCHACPPVR